MKHVHLVLIFRGICAMVVTPLAAQPMPFQLKQYGIEDGLSHRKVYDAVQDETGYLWLGTEDGLNRFDGYEFRAFGNKLDPVAPFAGSAIYHVEADQKGILWLGTNKGISLFNPRTFQSRNLLTTKYPFAHYNLKYKCYAHPDGTVWVNLSTEQGPEIWQYRDYQPSGLVIRQQAGKSGVYDDDVQVEGDSTGNTWIRFRRELVWINPSGQVRHYPMAGQENNYWQSLVLDEKGTVWLYDGHQLLFRFRPESGDFEQTGLQNLGQTWKGGSPAAYFVNEREWWLVAWPGCLVLYDPLTQTFQDISRAFYDITGAGQIGQIYKGRDQNIWICSENGLFQTQRKPQIFHTFLRSEGADFSTSCRKMLETATGKILIGTYGGLFQFEKNKSIQQISLKPVSNFVPYFLINDPVKSHIVWAGGEGSGKIHRIDLRTNTKKDIQPGSEKAFELEIEDEATFWVGSTSGLELFDLRSARFMPFRDTTGKFDFTKIFTNDILKNKRGEVWVGASEGLFKIDRKKGVLAHYPLNKPGKPEVSVLFIYEQNDSVFWLGTKGSGLFRLNHQTGEFRQLTMADGLPNNVIYAMLSYGDYLWMSTDNGLSRLHLPTLRFDNFTEADGLAHREFNNKSFLKASDGTFYFGGINGVTYFKPGDIQLSASQNEIFLSLYTRDDGASGELLTQDTCLDQLTTIRLGYRDRFFTLHIGLNNFTNVGRNTFAYLLEGYEHQWNHVGSQRTLRFNRLPPGTYTLKIKGADGNGIWSRERTIAVVVEAAFYKTGWFLTLCGLVIFGASYGIFRYRLARIREMEQMRTRIASDLHDEVGSILTRIAMQAQLAERKASDKDKSFLHLVAENSRTAISTMRDVIWTIDSRNDTVGELLVRMEDFAHAMFGPAGIAYQFKAENLHRDRVLDVKIRQNLYLIYKEAINNAVKHSGAKKVDIELKNESGLFWMKIKDDGASEKPVPAEGRRGQGLRNMEMRAARIEATLAVTREGGFEILLKRKAFN